MKASIDRLGWLKLRTQLTVTGSERLIDVTNVPIMMCLLSPMCPNKDNRSRLLGSFPAEPYSFQHPEDHQVDGLHSSFTPNTS